MGPFLPINPNIYAGYNENEIINLFNDQHEREEKNYDMLEICFTVYVITICSLTAAYIWVQFMI